MLEEDHRVVAAQRRAQQADRILGVGRHRHLPAGRMDELHFVGLAVPGIAALGGAGTRLVFDYILSEVINGTTRNYDALRKAQRVARLGEPWLFGLAPEQVPDFLASFDFKLMKDYEAAELRARYCPQRPMPMNYLRIVVCERL